jgi:hypothetical protein
MKVYDENNNCVECDQYVYDPHESGCRYENVCGLCECGWQTLSESLSKHTKINYQPKGLLV